MDYYEICLSRSDIDLITSCLSSCSASCFYSDNSKLGKSYLDLYDRLCSLVI